MQRKQRVAQQVGCLLSCANGISVLCQSIQLSETKRRAENLQQENIERECGIWRLKQFKASIEHELNQLENRHSALKDVLRNVENM